MKMIKRVGFLIGAFMLAMGVNIAQAADATPQLKVAVVNVQQILQQSPRVTELSKKLESEFKTRQSKITDDQRALQAQLDKLRKEAPTMNEKDRDAMQKKIAEDRSNLVKQVVTYQQDLQKEQSKIMQSILRDLNSIVSSIAKNQSYSLVLDSQAVIFANDSSDITKEVEKQFNEKK